MMPSCCGGAIGEEINLGDAVKELLKNYDEIKFEPVKRVIEENIPYNLPVRKTKGSAAYDIEAIEDIVIPSKTKLLCDLNKKLEDREYTLDELNSLTKGYRPTIVRTGMKVKMPDNYVCILIPRSSTALKYWMQLGNSLGCIDADFYSNPENDGEMGFIFVNNLPVDIKIKKGEIIGQALIIKRENVTDEEEVTTTRTGGYGSTTVYK